MITSVVYMYDSDQRPVSNRRPILKSMSDSYVTDICISDLCPFFTFSNWHPMTSHPLVQVFEAMMEKRQIPDERFLMTKKKEEKMEQAKVQIQKQYRSKES